jgi:DNA-binding transcriptional LysR family regulator
VEGPGLAELAAPAFTRFCLRFPEVVLGLREAVFADPRDLLRGGDVDAAVTNAPVTDKDLEQGWIVGRSSGRRGRRAGWRSGAVAARR